MDVLLQLAYSGMNVLRTALEEIEKLRAAEATGDPATIEAARQAAADRANAIADDLRAG